MFSLKIKYKGDEFGLAGFCLGEDNAISYVKSPKLFQITVTDVTHHEFCYLW